MSILAISLGVIARTLLLVITDFTKADLGKIGLAIFIGLVFAGRLEDWTFFPLGFAATIAFTYKDRIMPALTEGTILLYSLVGLFICLTFEPIPVIHSNESVFAFLTVTAILMLALCVTKIRLPFSFQVLLVVAFLAVSVYIGYQSMILVMLSDTSFGGQLLLGFYGLQFLSYCLYILNLIPFPTSKHQSFTDRWREVKQHASDLEQKYIDIDIHGWRTAGIIGIVIGLFVYAQFFTDLVTGVTVALTLGSFLATDTWVQSPQDQPR